MNAHPIVASVLIGYLLGSMPFGYMLVRIFRGADVRTTGSGNIGATNVARTSPLLGIVTLLLDAAKGLCAVAIILSIFPEIRWLAFIAAFASICGHVFPVWLGFRGGKGVATAAGIKPPGPNVFFPSSASIPPVSIMNAEPSASAQENHAPPAAKQPPRRPAPAAPQTRRPADPNTAAARSDPAATN